MDAFIIFAAVIQCYFLFEGVRGADSGVSKIAEVFMNNFKLKPPVSLPYREFSYDTFGITGNAVASDGFITEISQLKFVHQEEKKGKRGIFSYKFDFLVPKIVFTYKIAADTNEGSSGMKIRFELENSKLTLNVGGVNNSDTCLFEEPTSQLYLEPGQFDYELISTEDTGFFTWAFFPVIRLIVSSYMERHDSELLVVIEGILHWVIEQTLVKEAFEYVTKGSVDSCRKIIKND